MDLLFAMALYMTILRIVMEVAVCVCLREEHWRIVSLLTIRYTEASVLVEVAVIATDVLRKLLVVSSQIT